MKPVKYKRYIFMMSERNHIMLKAIAQRDQTSISQLIRSAIQYTYLNKWVPEKKEDYE